MFNWFNLILYFCIILNIICNSKDSNEATNLFTSKYNVPNLSFGSCARIDGQLYYLFGMKLLENRKNYNLSRAIYKLDLKEGFELKNEKAPWTMFYNEERPFTQVQGKTFQLGGEGSSQLLTFGGEVNGTMVMIFDIKKQEWILDQKSTQSFLNIFTNGHKVEGFYVTQFGFVQNDLDPEQFIFFGGFVGFKKKGPSFRVSNTYTLLYNSTSRQWSNLNIKFYHMFDPIAYSYNGRLYFFGGRNYQDKPYNIAQVTTFDFKTHKVEYKTSEGDVPSIAERQTFVRHGNILFVINEELEANQKNEDIESTIYTLDLDTLEWKAHTIEGFNPKFAACLDYFNGYLIYSFGGYEKASELTQVINTRRWEKVESLPPLYFDKNIKDSNSSNFTSSKSLNIGGLVGGLLGGFLIVFLIIFFILRYIYVKKQKRAINEALELPKYVEQPQFDPIDKVLDSNEVVFRHSTLSDRGLDANLFLDAKPTSR